MPTHILLKFNFNKTKTCSINAKTNRFRTKSPPRPPCRHQLSLLLRLNAVFSSLFLLFWLFIANPFVYHSWQDKTKQNKIRSKSKAERKRCSPFDYYSSPNIPITQRPFDFNSPKSCSIILIKPSSIYLVIKQFYSIHHIQTTCFNSKFGPPDRIKSRRLSLPLGQLFWMAVRLYGGASRANHCSTVNSCWSHDLWTPVVVTST